LVVFNIYEPPNPTRDRIDRAGELVFVKDGFSWLAAILPVIWFLVKGLWLELLVFLGIVAVLSWGIDAMGELGGLSGAVLLIVQIVLGFEAGTLQSAALERRGWSFVGTVTGHNQDDCERRFFETWQPSELTSSAPTGDGSVSWTATAWQNAKDGIARGRRLIGAKA
jgi:Protein of unknown function (DUF2628)